MANYKFFDADASILTAGSSVIGSVHYPVVKIFDSVLSVSQGGTNITSLVSTVPSSVLVGASIIGLTPVNISGTPNVNAAGSVVAFQGTASNLKVEASIIGTVPVTGSFKTEVASVIQQGTWNVSIVSTVPSSVIVGASVFGNVGISGTPNVNTAGSVVSFPGAGWSGSVVSFPGAGWSGSVAALITNPQSSVISRPAPIASIIQGTADLRVVRGASVAVIASPGAGIRNYIKYVQVLNFGSASVLVTIADNTTSILGYTIAPAGGGSNYECFYKAAINSPVTASLNGTASVLISAQGFTL